MKLPIGERIMLLRIRNHETKKALAESLGITPGCLSHWEKGRNEPSAYAIIQICNHYKVSADWLLGLVSDDAHPQRKKGEWIPQFDKWGDYVTTTEGYKCSECGEFDSMKDNFCPNCGADMRGEE